MQWFTTFSLLFGPRGEALPGVLGIQGERPFIFRDLGSTSKYLMGSGEQAKTFGDLGSTVKNVKNKK